MVRVKVLAFLEIINNNALRIIGLFQDVFIDDLAGMTEWDQPNTNIFLSVEV